MHSLSLNLPAFSSFVFLQVQEFTAHLSGSVSIDTTVARQQCGR